MKATDYLTLDESIAEKKILEWACPECGAENLPNESRECPECGYHMPEMLNDKIKKTWENIYKLVFGKIKGKLFEMDLPSANAVRFTNTLCKYGVLRRLRNGRFVEVLRIPEEFIVSCFVEGDMNRLRRMAYRRRKKEMMAPVRSIQLVTP